jgi:hypothetical protein
MFASAHWCGTKGCDGLAQDGSYKHQRRAKREQENGFTKARGANCVNYNRYSHQVAYKHEYETRDVPHSTEK